MEFRVNVVVDNPNILRFQVSICKQMAQFSFNEFGEEIAEIRNIPNLTSKRYAQKSSKKRQPNLRNRLKVKLKISVITEWKYRSLKYKKSQKYGYFLYNLK